MKKIFVLAALVSSVGLLHAASNNNNNGTNGGNYSSGYQSQYSQNGQTSSQSSQYGQTGQYGGGDQALMSQIQNNLKSPQYQNKYSNVNVSVSSGNATLSGTVATQEDKVSLGALVGGVNGVKSVNNQVTVQGQGQGSPMQSYSPSSGYGNSQGYGNGSSSGSASQSRY